MTDITYCTNNQCPYSRYCERGKVLGSARSFALFEPDDGECDHFIPIIEYRYDGVDEDGQHWLERLENGEPTERYIPIRMHEYERTNHA